jgi:diguanylate cyclase (GGDEF)-like protein
MSTDPLPAGHSPPLGRAAGERCARGRRCVAAARAIALATTLLCSFAPAAAESDFARRALAIEPQVAVHPQRALGELDDLTTRTDGTPAERRFASALHGQALILAGRADEALALADRLAAPGAALANAQAASSAAAPSTAPATARADNLALATALLLRSRVQLSTGDAAKANALAAEAHALVHDAADRYLRYWSAMTLGTSARTLGRLEEALASLQEALSLAESMGHPLRRSNALYQLSVLHLMLKRPQDALQASLDAFAHGERAASAYAMANARMAESAAMEVLDDPARELAAMEEALAIARHEQSPAIEARALINLADIRLRRRQFREALDLSRHALQLATHDGDPGLVATSKANMGFAWFGLGRVQDGKRLADEALAEYERSGATAEIATLLGEYGQYLERAGDYRAALALFHRERRLHDEIGLAARQRALLEIQEKYESDKRKREIALLARENGLQQAELETRALQQRAWWLLAAVFALSFAVVAALYRKLRVTNRLLAERNTELSARSSRDPLTALYNRRYFQELIRDEQSRPDRRRRNETESGVRALLLIDIDRFKEINDRHGHAAGDAVLVVVARRLREALRETDTIVRWGGEEFLVFVPAASGEHLDEIAMRIMHAISAEPVVYQGAAIRVTASVGYLPMPLPPYNVELPWERAIGLADMALYMAKVHGRNRAYGIRGLRRGDDASLARIEQDLEQSWKDGAVEMQELPGPQFYVYPPTGTVAEAESAPH